MSTPWPEVPLTEVADLIRGVSYPKSDSRGDPGPGYMPVLRATNIQDARLVLESDLVYVAASNVSPAQRLRPGDIVIATSSGSKHLVGKSALLRGAWEGSFGAFCAGIRPRANIDPRYLAYFLQSPRYWKEIGRKALGVNINNLRRGDLETLLLPLPSVAEQRELVNEVEKQFSRLDEAVANLKRVKTSISRYKASALSDAAGLDGRWTTKRIADLLRERIVNGLSVKESTTPTSIRALRLSAMSECGLNYADHRFLPVAPVSVDDILVEEGDFFVSRGNGSLALVGRGTTAQAPPFPIIFPDTMMRLRFIDDEIRGWVATLWPSRFVRRQIEQRVKTTAGIYKIAQPQVGSISVPLPPASERGRIMANVDRRLSIVREVEGEVDANLKRAEALRQAVLASTLSRGA